MCVNVFLCVNVYDNGLAVCEKHLCIHAHLPPKVSKLYSVRRSQIECSVMSHCRGALQDGSTM